MDRIEHLGMTDNDLAEIRRGIAAADVRGDAVLRYWSADRRILWLGLHHGGHLTSWLMVPAVTGADADRQADHWVAMVAEGLKVQAEVADAIAGEALRGAGSARH